MMNPEWPLEPEHLERLRQEALETFEARDERWVFNWFSNFLPLKVPIKYEGLEYYFAESFYQAMKSQDPEYRKAIAKCDNPSKTKFLAAKLSRRGEIRPDWHNINIAIMTYAQRHKIETDPEFYDHLRLTRGEAIIEFNNWTDLFWGVSIYTGQGEGVLGRILMHLRDDIFWPQALKVQ